MKRSCGGIPFFRLLKKAMLKILKWSFKSNQYTELFLC